MSISPRKIASNTTFYIIALSIQKVLSFIYFSYLARSLGAELTGKYFFALSVAAIIIVFMDLGLTPLVTRELSKFKDQSKILLSQVVALKILYTGIVVIASFIVIPFFIPEELVRHMLYIAVGVAVLDSMSLVFFGAIRANQNLFYESISTIVYQIIVLSFGVGLIYNKADLRLLILVLFVASVFNSIFSLLVLKYKIGLALTLRLSGGFVRTLWKQALPFAWAAVFIKIYAYIDTVFLKFFQGDEAVGLYSVAYKITFAFQFLPLAFIAALYPAFSYYWKHDKNLLYITLSKSFQYLLVISIPITVGIAALADHIIPQVYTAAYSGSVMSLIILIISLPFLFLNFPVNALLNACDRQKRQTMHLGITMLVNIVLNILLIPHWGPVGAAISSSLSTLFIFILGMHVVPQITSYDRALYHGTILKLLLISVVMLIIARGLLHIMPWYLTIIPTAIFYVGAIFVLRVITFRDLISFKSVVRK